MAVNWNEKYRPKNLDEVLGQGHIVDKLKNIRDQIKKDGTDPDVAHFMFAGEPGTGKTATAIAYCKDCFGENWKLNYTELNASDEGNIEHIRDIVKRRSKQGTIGTFKTEKGEMPIPFNIIFLDEADNLSPKAQAALRRIMEETAKYTKFIISCNYPDKIISPISDRCAFSELRFHVLSDSAIISNLDMIIKNEGIQIDDDAKIKIASLAKGSMRKAQNILYESHLLGRRIKLNDLSAYPGFGNFDMKRLVENVRMNDFDTIDKYIDDLYYRKGVTVREIVRNIAEHLFKDDKIPADEKTRYITVVAEFSYRISICDSHMIQLKAMVREMGNKNHR